MANLIITIISIALVAVAAIMGAFYGGTAFLNSQIQAQANKINNDLTQIQAAAQLYEMNTGTTNFGNAWNASTYLNNSTYVTTWPVFPQTSWSQNAGNYNLAGQNYQSQSQTQNVAFMTIQVVHLGAYVDAMPLSTPNQALNVCLAYNKINTPNSNNAYGSNGSSATPVAGNYAIPACSNYGNGWVVTNTGSYINSSECCGGADTLNFFRIF